MQQGWIAHFGVNYELLRVLLSGVLGALLGSGVTQLLTHQRERTKLLVEKLEKLMELLQAFLQRAMHRQLFAQGSAHVSALNFNDTLALDMSSKCEALVTLHFPQLAEDFNRVKVANLAFWNYLEELGTGAIRNAKVESTLNDKLYEALETLIRRLYSEAGSLTGRPVPVMKAWIDRKCAGQ